MLIRPLCPPPCLSAALLATALLLGPAAPAAAGPTEPSQASAASLAPVALLLAAPPLLLSGASQLTVVAVQASAEGTVWVLERASDGAQASVQLSATVAQGASVVVGTALTVSAVATGWLLGQGTQLLAFVPNERGARLLHHERVMR